MTENEWLACTDPVTLMSRLSSARKSRLFACACCRYFFYDPHGADLYIVEKILEPIGRYADGLVGEDERQAAEEEALSQDAYTDYAWNKRLAIISTATYSISVCEVWSHLQKFVDSQGVDPAELIGVGCRVLRDLLGNPFRPTTIDSSWLGFNDGTVPKIAQRIYDKHDCSLMPILADALEDAGCDNDAILRHCREPGEHVRGCWVVDLLLGKESQCD